ncbi:tyrosine-protein phosphatase [Ancylobacter vacuolatus]|uniref:protein-tyrosine-phosphatase n=1 Tax=Ancylobacter vacuolatus TaxID=223389 RepID=A0ABU0DKN0_9HYPH|nr:CpsB/CapC family capsule biosynthesis tyrosine phosphatase [Ancylobacter vacuolatus]MDQ0348993.1 protein-tyrosine phosphatase [Ancylobacter vacuolatus]
MIDLHNHILPGIDDGAADLSVSVEMARMHVAQGVEIVACTPHILPGVYHNEGEAIRRAVDALQQVLDEAGVPLILIPGADNHVVPDFVDELRKGRLLTLGDTRYVLVEPPHNVAPARLDELVFTILLANYVPILTHPERLKWIEEKYELIERMAAHGIWMQITSGSLTGRFGRRPKYWAERMIGEGRVHILASDAHDTVKRPPDLAEGRLAAERLVGAAEAAQMTVGRPRDIVLNRAPSESAPIGVVKFDEVGQEDRGGLRAYRSAGSGAGDLLGRLRRLFGR